MRPIITIDGGHEVNEVFFDDVQVPAENLVGEENKGWDYAKFLLGHERTSIARVGVSKMRVRRIKDLAAKVPGGRRRRCGTMRIPPAPGRRRDRAEGAGDDADARGRGGAAARGRASPIPATSILKIKGTELQQATTELLMEVAGPYALPYRRG